MVDVGFIGKDTVVADELNGVGTSVSVRSRQRHFIAATGLTLSTVRQIERARSAALLLLEGQSIADAVCAAGYFDQAHLTKALKRYIGLTPSSLVSRSGQQLSYLY
jgi:methylphosphotriester-DNA--protein-cysteine methyltransferase